MASKLQELKKLRESFENFSVVGELPSDDPSILIANHTCLMDILYLPMAIPIPSVTLVGAGTLFKKEKQKHQIRQQTIDKYLYTMPIEAHGGSILSYKCLDFAAQIAKNGIGINIFPEGAYVNENVIYKGRTGASRVLFNVRSAGINIYLVPVAIDVIDENLDMNAFSTISKSEVRISILDPINYEEAFTLYSHSVSDSSERRTALHTPIDEGMRKIAMELGKEYVDEYIGLTPRNTLVLPDGTTINTQEVKSHLPDYEEALAARTRKLIRDIKKN